MSRRTATNSISLHCAFSRASYLTLVLNFPRLAFGAGYMFSRVWHGLHAFLSGRDWFIALLMSAVIGWIQLNQTALTLVNSFTMVTRKYKSYSCMMFMVNFCVRFG